MYDADERVVDAAFFIPKLEGAERERVEEAYAKLANICGCPIPPSDKRIRSIRFTQDTTDYVATVGQPRIGTKYPRTRGRIDYSRPQRSPSGPVIWAIFAGDPAYRIFHEPVPSQWHNPAYVGPAAIREVEYFRAD